MSPERPHSADVPVVPKMSVPASPIAGTPAGDVQSPISLLLAVAQSQSSRTGDDDLTSLSWLHEKDLLKGMNINPSPQSSTSSTPVKNGMALLQDLSPTSDYDESSFSTAESSNSSLNSPVPSQNFVTPTPTQSQSQRLRHPHNLMYDPMLHTNYKPPYSFSCLIFMAIEDSKQKALPVKEIYAWILDHFPYFKNAPTGWKNSVRHNLSLNKCFLKVEKAPNLGKGSLWTVDPQYKPNLIQAVNRSLFHPGPGSNTASVDPGTYPTRLLQSSAGNAHRFPVLTNPELFPFLSKKFAANELKYDNEQVINLKIGNEELLELKKDNEESLDAVDAAAVMLSLKNATKLENGLKMEKNALQVITTSPSQDHTYSAANSANKSVEIFESEEDRAKKTSTCRKIDFEDEEERKIKEGAETLLNLAGIAHRKRLLAQPNLFEENKKIKLEDINSMDEKFAPFKPRLLRTKRKEKPSKVALTNNNQDDWVKYRRELDMKQTR